MTQVAKQADGQSEYTQMDTLGRQNLKPGQRIHHPVELNLASRGVLQQIASHCQHSLPGLEAFKVVIKPGKCARRFGLGQQRQSRPRARWPEPHRRNNEQVQRPGKPALAPTGAARQRCNDAMIAGKEMQD
jgi:hypothetical protein